MVFTGSTSECQQTLASARGSGEGQGIHWHGSWLGGRWGGKVRKGELQAGAGGELCGEPGSVGRQEAPHPMVCPGKAFAVPSFLYPKSFKPMQSPPKGSTFWYHKWSKSPPLRTAGTWLCGLGICMCWGNKSDSNCIHNYLALRSSRHWSDLSLFPS